MVFLWCVKLCRSRVAQVCDSMRLSGVECRGVCATWSNCVSLCVTGLPSPAPTATTEPVSPAPCEEDEVPLNTLRCRLSCAQCHALWCYVAGAVSLHGTLHEHRHSRGLCTYVQIMCRARSNGLSAALLCHVIAFVPPCLPTGVS